MGYSLAKSKTDYATHLTYSDFLQQVEGGDVRAVRIEGSTVVGEYKDKGGEFRKFKTTTPPQDESLIQCTGTINLLKQSFPIPLTQLTGKVIPIHF